MLNYIYLILCLVVAATMYSSYSESPRLARRLKLNTIVEVESVEESGNEARRGRRRSDVSPSSCYSHLSASTISSYYEGSLGSEPLEDLYGVSDSESDCGNCRRTKRHSTGSELTVRSRSQHSDLAIPSPRHWPTIEKLQKQLLTVVPPTPPPQILLSPALLSKLSTRPAGSATPSLDGSLTSDQQASISAPSTPDIADNPAHNVDWSRVDIARASADFAEDIGPTIEVGMEIADLESAGVQLPAEALDLLQHLSMEIHSSQLEQNHPTEEALSGYPEMQEVACILRDDAPIEEVDPVSATSEYSLAELSIPSPGGFFSSLDAGSRATWSTNPTSILEPPSSTTAEHFYNAPWNKGSPQVIEHVINVYEDGDGNTTEGPLTVRYAPFSAEPTPLSGVISIPLMSPVSGHESRAFGLAEIDEQLREAAESGLSRAAEWAAQQCDVLHSLAGKESPNSSACPSDNEAELKPAQKSPRAIVGKGKRKSVKFLDTERANAAAKDAATKGSDSIFYHAFQTLSNQSSPTDSFIHRHSRFDAMQALRVSLRHTHIDSLLGHFATVDNPQKSAPRPISMMPGAKNSDDPEVVARRAAALQRERERQAFEQVAPAMWIVEAMRYLAGGQLLNSPAGDMLARAKAPLPMGARGPPPPAVRVLDLGGQPQCDWAWHCAREYPNVRTYTATCDDRAVNLSLRGPRNHRLVRVERLYQLPFPDGYFDVVSARSLPQFLRAVATTTSAASATSASFPDSSAAPDEYDACLAECLRVLKPGGFLEYFILDAELIQPGPKGEAASVEFAVNLKSRGYDAAPTRAWLRRVRGAGFTGIKRAWMFLPLGAIRTPDTPLPETPPPPVLPKDRIASLTSNTSANGAIGAPDAKRGLVGPTVHDFKYEGDRPVEAVHGPVGCAAEAAHISGLVGSCLWERWMLKLQMEMGREVGLLDGIGAVVEEGRWTGAGWRCMSGWARKPLQSLKTG